MRKAGTTGWMLVALACAAAGASETPECLNRPVDRVALVLQEVLRDNRPTTLEELNASGAEALPALTRSLDGPYAPEAAALLVRMGAPAVPTMIAGLRTDDEVARQILSSGLAVQGKPAVPSLVVALSDSSPNVRQGALDALLILSCASSKTARLPAEAAPVLKGLLDDEDPYVRGTAVALLADVLPPEESIPALVGALGDSSKTVRSWAAGDLMFRGKAAVEALRRTLRQGSPTARKAAAVVLGAMGRMNRAADAATADLVQALGDEEPMVRRAAAFALGRLDARLRLAIPPLIEALEQPGTCVDWLGPATAACQLAAIGEAALDRLVETLGHPNEVTRAYAAMALARIGRPALQRLNGVVLSPESRLQRRGAVRAISYMGAEAAGALPMLVIYGVSSDDGPTRMFATRAIGHVGMTAEGAVPKLATLLREDTDLRVREAAARSLGAIAAGGGRTVEPLWRAPAPDNPEERESFSRITASFPGKPRPAMPALVAALKDPQPRVRLAAAKALGDADPKVQKASGALEIIKRHAPPARFRYQATVEPVVDGLPPRVILALAAMCGHFTCPRPGEGTVILNRVETASSHLGPDAIPFLLQMLAHSPGEESREVAGMALQQYDPRTRSIATYLAAHPEEDLGVEANPADLDACPAWGARTLPLLGGLETGSFFSSPQAVMGQVTDILPGDLLAVRALRTILAHSRDVWQREAAAAYLADYEDHADEAATALMEALVDKPLVDWWVPKAAYGFEWLRHDPLESWLGVREVEHGYRQTVARSLGRLYPASRAALCKALSDEPVTLRRWAAHALGEVRQPDQEATEALARALNDPAWQVRAEAAVALGKLRHRPARNLLERTSREDPNPQVRECAQAALGALTARSGD